MPSLHLPTLLFVSCAALLASALSLTLLSRVQQVYGGYFSWVSAMWLAAIGLCLLTLDGQAVTVVGQALLLAWPALTVLGFRRFHRRAPPMPGSVRGDAILYAVGLAIVIGCAVVDDTLAAAGFALAGVLLYGNATALLWAGPVRRESPMVQVLAALLLATTLGFAAAALMAARDAALPAPASGLVVVPVALSMLVLVLRLTHERAENELRHSRRRLRFLANIDTLTRVPNRRRFGELARRALDSEKGRGAMLMFDIDHFKQINDVLGHAVGDRALTLVARGMQETLRPSDIPGRHGGDEFVLLLPRTSVQDAMAVASRITDRVRLLAEQNGIASLSLSFGAVQTQRGESIDEALHRADQALYEAKRQGRSRVVGTCAATDSQAAYSESRRLGLTTL